MTSPYLMPVYAAYAAISVALTVWLARTLFKSGAVFLRDVFKDQPDLSEAVNRLLVVGFYLVNLGYAALLLKADGAASPVEAFETLSWKLGLLLMSLAVMHFGNLYLFHRIRRRALEPAATPPLPPSGYTEGRPWASESEEPHAAFSLLSKRDRSGHDAAAPEPA